MNKSYYATLKAFRKLYLSIFGNKKLSKVDFEQSPQESSRLIYEKLMADEPCMIARFGSTELVTMVNYLGIKQSKPQIIKYISGKSLPWWWNQNMIQQMQKWSGFFPPTQSKIEQFCELMLTDMKEVDILGSWLNDESYFENDLGQHQKVHLRLLEPFWSDEPWSRALKNKKVLVVHPFAETVLRQYKNRSLLFSNPSVLPDFESLTVIQAVQTLGKPSEEFKDWFEALDYMKLRIDQADYDVCLIGAGAYGFPLAAHVKRNGKKAIHLGGALQLLFGIRGKRWEDPTYGVREWGIEEGTYSSLMNDSWVRPLDVEKPKTAQNVEGACYW